MAAEEIELKLGLSPAGMARLSRALARETGTLPAARRLRTLYFDSSDRRLAAAGIALRLRRTDAGWVQSLKAGRAAMGGFQHSREDERPVVRPRPSPAAIADPRLAGEVAAALEGAPLRPWFETRVRRRTCLVQAEGGVVEVALDEGQIRAGAARAPLCEAEFELKGGSPEALFALAGRLVEGLDVRLALPNKAERGAALAAGAPWQVAARGSRPPAVAPGAPAGELVDRLLAGLAAAIAANLDLVMAADSPEGPHQLRIALRRLRALLWLYRPLVDRQLARDLAAGARDLGRIVAPLRDADVLAGDLLVPRAGPDLARALAAWREAVRTQARAALAAAGAGCFGVRLLGLAALGGWQRAGHRERLVTPHAAIARPALERLWRRLHRQGRAFILLSAEERHEFRKNVKKFRYAMEITEETEEAGPFLKALKQVQEDLGGLNDLDVLDRFRPDLGQARLDDELEALRESLTRGRQGRVDQLTGRACRHVAALLALPLPLPPAGTRTISAAGRRLLRAPGERSR